MYVGGLGKAREQERAARFAHWSAVGKEKDVLFHRKGEALFGI
jgi:hypothetical protein